MNKKYLVLFAIFLTVISFVALPIRTKAKTVKEFEAEVEKYTKELEERKSKIATNESEIKKIKAEIAETEKSIATAEEEIEALQEEIEEMEEEIRKKSEESKNIMAYYQVSNGENAYLEYAFGANDITDMIYRISIVEQLTEYNDNIMKELDELIKKNQEKQKELEGKKEELANLKKELEDKQSRIELDNASIKAGMPGLEEQLKSAKSQLNYAKNLGCGASEDLSACIYRVNQSRRSASGGGGGGAASLPSTNGFFRPMEYGYVTQGYTGCISYNYARQACTGHTGIDLSSSDKSITIYPIADGQVTARYYDNAGALVVKVRHNYQGRYIYSTYAHLRSWSVSLYQYVTSDTPIGQMGSTGNSTGPHLHLEITDCDWKSECGGCTWENYAKYGSMNPRNFVQIPGSWSNR